LYAGWNCGRFTICVVHQHIDTAELRAYRVDHRRHVRTPGDVSLYGEPAPAARLDLGDDPRTELSIARGDGDVRARFGHCERKGPAESAVSSRHQHTLALQAEAVQHTHPELLKSGPHQR
jgi:hypothetical protein